MTGILCTHSAVLSMTSLVHAIQEGNVEKVQTLSTNRENIITQITTPLGGWGSHTPLTLAIALSRHKHCSDDNVANYRAIKRILFGICGGHEKKPYLSREDRDGECYSIPL
jgi:hypothetical protein